MKNTGKQTEGKTYSYSTGENNALFYHDAFRDRLLNFTLANTAPATQY